MLLEACTASSAAARVGDGAQLPHGGPLLVVLCFLRGSVPVGCFAVGDCLGEHGQSVTGIQHYEFATPLPKTREWIEANNGATP